MQCAPLPCAHAAVRVSSVSRLCALLVLPSLVNFGGPVQVKSKSSPSQVESGRAIPRGPKSPYWSSSPLRPQYPFLHTIKANLTPPASSFPSTKEGPSLG